MAKPISTKNTFSNLRPTTRLAIQIFVALSLINLLATACHLPRAYWAGLTAVSVLCQTWGESLRKSTQRLLATIGGLTLGSLLYYPLQNYPLIMLGLVFVNLFLMSYFITVSYPKAMFFVSIFLAMLFGVMGTMTFTIYWVRIMETFVGSAIAILVSIILLPTHITDEVRNALQQYISNQAEGIKKTLQQLTADPAKATSSVSARQALNKQFSDLRLLFDAYAREAALRRAPVMRIKRLIVALETIRYYHINLEQMAECRTPNPMAITCLPQLQQTASIIHDNLLTINAYLDGKKPPALQPLNSISDHIRTILTERLEQHPEQQADIVRFLPTFYFAFKINNSCEKMFEIIARDANASVKRDFPA